MCLPCVGDPAVHQRLLQHVPALEQDLHPVFHRDSVGPELVRLVAGADAEQHPAARKRLQHPEFLRHPERLVQRKHDDRRAELDPAGDRGAVPRHQQRRGADGVAGEMVLGEPRRVEPGLVGEAHLLNRHAQDVGRGLVGAVLRHEVEKGDLHHWAQAPRRMTVGYMTASPRRDI